MFVLSIPDWGLTPFAAGRDTARITKEISAFNSINHAVSSKYSVSYIDITSGSPETARDTSFLASDGLHPSGKAYGRWSALLFSEILKRC